MDCHSAPSPRTKTHHLYLGFESPYHHFFRERGGLLPRIEKKVKIVPDVK